MDDSSESYCVLVVDDDDTVRRVLTRMLQRGGFHVSPVSSGMAAVEHIRGGARCDLAVIDMTMPHMDGLQTLSALRDLLPDLPVIISSGYSASDSVERALELGRTESLAE